MAGSLIKIDEEIVTSAVSSVTLTGIDSTYDVFKVVWTNGNNVDRAPMDSNQPTAPAASAPVAKEDLPF